MGLMKGRLSYKVLCVDADHGPCRGQSCRLPNCRSAKLAFAVQSFSAVPVGVNSSEGCAISDRNFIHSNHRDQGLSHNPTFNIIRPTTVPIGSDNDLSHKTGLQTDIPTISHATPQTNLRLEMASQINQLSERCGQNTAYSEKSFIQTFIPELAIKAFGECVWVGFPAAM